MQFTHEFEVEADIDLVLAALTDLERVAACMPGASVEGVSDDGCSGRLKAKVGSIQLVYSGTAQFVEVDRTARRVTLAASGREIRGPGTAKVHVVATLSEKTGGTVVTLDTDMTVTGRPAQFGRGVMHDIGTRIVDKFAIQLQEMVESDPLDVDGANEGASPLTAKAGPAEYHSTHTHDAASGELTKGSSDSLDLLSVALWPTLKRLAPILAVMVALAVWWIVQG